MRLQPQRRKDRPANVDDRLTIRMFGWSTRGFAAAEDRSVAVCLLPGTELSFAEEVRKVHSWPWSRRPSATRRRSFVRSIKAIRRFITMPSNSPMVGSSW